MIFCGGRQGTGSQPLVWNILRVLDDKALFLSLWKKETTSSKRHVHGDEPPVSLDRTFMKTLLPIRRLASPVTQTPLSLLLGIGRAPDPPSSWRPTATTMLRGGGWSGRRKLQTAAQAPGPHTLYHLVWFTELL